jgi:hypothetical protein
MIDNSFPESKLEWFLSKFKNAKGEITASHIRKKGDKKYSHSDWRMLMSLAVQRGYAKDNGRYSKNDKYGIYMVSEKIVLFDYGVLDQSIYKNLPPGFLRQHLTNHQQHVFDCLNAHWIEIYSAFFRYQIGEDVNRFTEGEDVNWITGEDTDFLFLMEDYNEMISIRAKKLICLYKLIDLGWQDLIANTPSLAKSHHYSLFYEILLMNSIMDFTKTISEGIGGHRSSYEKQLKITTAIKDKYCDDIESRKILGREKFDLLFGDKKNELNVYSKSLFIQDILSEYDMYPVIKEILKIWQSKGDNEACLLAGGQRIQEILNSSKNSRVQEALEDLKRACLAFDEYELARQRRNANGTEPFILPFKWSKNGDLLF